MSKGKSLIRSVVSDGFTPTSIFVLKIVDSHPECSHEIALDLLFVVWQRRLLFSFVLFLNCHCAFFIIRRLLLSVVVPSRHTIHR
jgi:hypothetical protein